MPDSSVVLLERGAPRTPRQDLIIRSPRFFGQAWLEPELTESWPTLPNPGVGGKVLTQLTGNTLGGSSAVNGAQWTKPPLSTFDKDIWSFTGALLRLLGPTHARTAGCRFAPEHYIHVRLLRWPIVQRGWPCEQLYFG